MGFKPVCLCGDWSRWVLRSRFDFAVYYLQLRSLETGPDGHDVRIEPLGSIQILPRLIQLVDQHRRLDDEILRTQTGCHVTSLRRVKAWRT